MKRILSGLIVLLILMIPAYSQDSELFVVLNDEALLYKDQIYIKNGRTMVDSTLLFEAFQLELEIDEEKKMLYGHKDGISIGLSLDQKKGYINDGIVLLDASAEIKDDKIYVPLRFVAESIGANVAWDSEKNLVTIEWFPYENTSIRTLLKKINEDSQLGNIDFGLQRERYHEIIKQTEIIKKDYEDEQAVLLLALENLSISNGFKLNGESVKDLMENFHKVLMPVHSKSNKGDSWVNEDGYYHLNYELGYYYGYYENSQAEGYKFGYTAFDEGYVLSLVPYERNKRNGIGYKIVYDVDGQLKYDMFYKMDDNINNSLEYVRYASGIQTFDRGDVSGDSVVRVEASGEWYIPPIDIDDKSHVYNEGLGYYSWNEGVEYVGFFDQWDILGEGMFYGKEDGYLNNTNLLEQRSLEILLEILDETMTEEEKIKEIHDYLAEHIRYDNLEVPNSLSHTAYGSLILGEGVCDGYAGSFKYILDLIEIENVIVFGTSRDIYHAWNLVKVDGSYYHYDITWDDEDKGEPKYTYYKKDNEFFKATHKWDEERYEIYFPK